MAPGMHYESNFDLDTLYPEDNIEVRVRTGMESHGKNVWKIRCMESHGKGMEF